MDATLYVKILSDKNILDLKKLTYKYPRLDIKALVDLFRASIYKTIPLGDFNGNDVVYMENITQIRMNAVKLLLTPQSFQAGFGLKAMEEEISSTLTIENIDFDRKSVRKILQGYAPADEGENRVYGMKKGLEFISNPSNNISEKNIFALYDLAVGQYLNKKERLGPNEYYRQDAVYIVEQDIEHIGLPHKKLPEYMSRLIAFIEQDSHMNDLIKAAVIHFYFAYLHPYFDGNGRMARLLHLWYLRRRGYTSALFVPFSSYIERSRKQYYKAYSLAEKNARISNVLDMTPFLVYFVEHVYNKLEGFGPRTDMLEVFARALEEGAITAKEKDLWNFVLSAYGVAEFSTKQLERDFAKAAYATIRKFVLKFTDLGLLNSHPYGNKIKYSIGDTQK